MSNKFHRKLSDGELHRPERTGEGDPNEQSLFQVEDGQYYQDTLTGDLWRYVASSNAWELLLDYDRQNNLITNAQQRYDIKTQQIGELRSNITAGSSVTSVDAYLFTQVRQGEDITVYQSSNTDNAISFTVTADNEGGDTTISVESEKAFYNFLVGDPIKLDAGLLSAYQSADPTKIYSSISEERNRISIGKLLSPIAKDSVVTSLSIERQTSQTLELRDGQILYIYGRDGIGQFIDVNGDQTLNGFTITINVNSFTASYLYDDVETFIVEPAWASTTQITQTANTVSILSTTVSENSNSIASINTRTGVLESNVTALASVNDGQNTSIATAQLTANSAFAAANLAASVNDGQNTSIASVNTLATNALAIANLAASVNDGQNTSIASVNTLATNALAVATLAASVNDGQNSSIASLNTIATDAYAAANTSVKYNNVGAYIELIAGEGGSNITLAAQQINISGVITAINDEGATQINGSKIETGTITATEINVTDLLGQTLEVGNVIKSTNFDSNNGFAVYSNGKAFFRDVVIDGTSVDVTGAITTGTGSNVNGQFVNNINAGNIVVGTLDASRINVDEILAVDADISGNLTITSGKIEFSGIDGGMAIQKISSDIAGITGTETLRLDGRRIEIGGTQTGNTQALISDEGGSVKIVSGTGVQLGFFGSQGQIKSTITGNAPTGSAVKNLIAELDDHGLVEDNTTNSAISLAHGGTGSSLSDPGGDEILYWNDTFNEVRWLDPSPPLNIAGDQLELSYGGGLIVASGQLKLANDITISGNVQASYKSDDGTAGISATRSWYDSAALETHNVVIKNGIITQWTVTS